ncbi:methyltransferase domain-containing protein [Kamptonema cortianum]|uniref:Methyltransferase domain-containing protein n=1 Tax=Geitlerinema calcuttense NRMC-F 0142 TaxID=2922238 RepID=A0ABT7M044_9CYAN|nr:methyltransferase domain-containing protein [Geitlerinema calcuttense]MDK3160109.1 methyltransferase domain-containing protein [Kamptonema cortianum]MDL5057642.1 methyltransferase domain-containing protein [Geitlerinema calcuttense NRMC-F 0142]
MSKLTAEMVENLRQHFNTAPYPRIPLERSPKDEPPYQLYIHSLVTPYYIRDQKVVSTEGKVILDAGCGSGYKALLLAEANPGAQIIGIDISEKSVELARDRFRYHGLENGEFHAMKLEELTDLPHRFDYINCDEVLYLLPDPLEGLKAMKAVLTPQGIIRTNLHSLSQRLTYYIAQEAFTLLGVRTDAPQEEEVQAVREIMAAIKDEVWLKKRSWDDRYFNEENEERILANHILRGDRGFTVREMFDLLDAAGLEHIEMIQNKTWQVKDLFEDSDRASQLLGINWEDIPKRQNLEWFEMLHSSHRLIDFWCGNPQVKKEKLPIAKWSDIEWRKAKVSLHPRHQVEAVKAQIIQSIKNKNSIVWGYQLPLSTESVPLDSSLAACLLPLWEKSMTMTDLLEIWLKINPIDPITLETKDSQEAFIELKQALEKIHEAGVVFIEVDE